jgi:uncharacterized OB-fold protein
VSDRPVPVPDDTSAPYWEAAAAGALALARCSRCQAFVHPPEPVCPVCRSSDPAFEFVPVDGSGVLRSWTVVRRPFLPGFAEDLPIVLADVALDGAGDVRLIGRLLDGPGVPLTIGDRVRVAFERIHDGDEVIGVPAFVRSVP